MPERISVTTALIPRFVPRPLARQVGRAYGFFMQTEDGSSMLNRVFERPVGAITGHPERVLDYDPTCVPQLQREHREFTWAFRSALPRSSRVNAALSIYAWGLHVADQLIMPNGRVNPIHTEPFKEIA
jgi:hypothetical protein